MSFRKYIHYNMPTCAISDLYSFRPRIIIKSDIARRCDITYTYIILEILYNYIQIYYVSNIVTRGIPPSLIPTNWYESKLYL